LVVALDKSDATAGMRSLVLTSAGALVEQAAAAAESLEEQAHNLNEAVGSFRLSH
jgi:methyl-accepting chemotaxis protein